MIEQEKIDAIKRDTDLKAYIESRGIHLNKNGKGYFGLCPFHDDKNPSLSVTADNLWQCFGCGAGGDVIRFVELFDKIPFPEAIKKLTGSDIKKIPPKISVPADKPAPDMTIKQKKLLAKVVTYYQHTFGQDTRGMDYLKNERGITNNKTLEDFGVGFANGSLLSILPEDEAIIDTLRQMGILNKDGSELFNNCVVFPMYDAKGSVVNLYGRSIDDQNRRTVHLYLPGTRTGLVNRQAAGHSKTILLSESIIDAITLYDQGFKNVMPIYGVNGLTDDHLFFFNRRVNEIYLVMDADEPGQQAANKISLRLKEKKITSYTVNLPVKDVNLFFKRHTPEEFEALLKKANPKSLEQSEIIGKRKQTLYQPTEHGFIVGFGDRQYEIKGIQRSETQLKVTIKAATDVTTETPFELSTIDFYSSRSRLWFAKLCAGLFNDAEELVKEDVGKLLAMVERYQPKEAKTEAVEITPAERETAMRFLKNPKMFDEILADLEILGVTGEENNKLIGYLAAISRKLDDPLSVLIQSRSAAGKSTLQDAILSLVPEEDYVKYTRITDQALFYKEEEALMNKLVAIEEEVGMGGAAYSIRNIQSAKKITVAATGKDPGTGKMTTEEYTVKGPVAVMITTTAADVEGETGSRFIFLTIDETTKMTDAIHQKQREAETLEGIITHKKTETIIKKHHTAQRLLKPLAVANPYSKYLRYPNQSIRTRRDHKKYLGMIRAIAYLFQYQRKIKKVTVDGEPVQYIEVTLKDIDQANTLANDVLGHSLDDLAKPSRTLLAGILDMTAEIALEKDCGVSEVFFTRRMIREYMNWTDWQIKTHIKQLEDLEYLYVHTGSQGKRYSYALNYHCQGEDKCYLNLTKVAEIKKLIKKDKDKNL